MKQYNYKPRSNSQSSGTSGQAAGSPPKEESKTAGTGGASIAQQAAGATAGATAGAAGRRRVSLSHQIPQPTYLPLPFSPLHPEMVNPISSRELFCRTNVSIAVLSQRCRQIQWPQRRQTQQPRSRSQG